MFITRRGEVLAVVLSPKDYDELWWHEFDVDMKRADEETVFYTTDEVMQHIAERQKKLLEKYGSDVDTTRTE